MPSEQVKSPHPATWTTEQLLEQCDLRTQRRSGPGGQHRNKTSSCITSRQGSSAKQPNGEAKPTIERSHCHDYDYDWQSKDDRDRLSMVRYRQGRQRCEKSTAGATYESTSATKIDQPCWH